jgi:hypothetical protein
VKTVFIDFESYSELSLAKVGPMVYSLHPSTQILCLSWRTNDGESNQYIGEDMPKHFVPLGRLFNKPALDRLFQIIADPTTLVEAHNAFFEKCIWWNIGVLKLHWPIIGNYQWRCSAARAAACALPRALDNAGAALHLFDVKDNENAKTAMRMCKPWKPTKKQPLPPNEWWDILYEYNRGDTIAEYALSDAMPPLSDFELEVWRTDQRMNARGIPCDVAGARKAVSIAKEWTDQLNDELSALTGNTVKKATQRERIIDWLTSRGVSIDNTQALTLDTMLEDDSEEPTDFLATATLSTDPGARRVVEIVRSICRSSVSKYVTLLKTSIDGRMHDTQVYHGASTGRWCLTPDAEVLTPYGWLRFDEWDAELEPIAEWDTDNSISFRYGGKVVFPYSGPMCELNGEWFASSSTPDHNFPVRNKASRQVRRRTAESLDSSGRQEIPLAGFLKGPFKPSTMTQVIVMFQADGSVYVDKRRDNPPTLYRLGFRKQRKIDRCHRLLNNAGIQFSEFIDSEGSTRIIIRASDCPEWLKRAKHFGDWLLEHDPTTFTEETRHWDGSSDKHDKQPGIEYSTCSKNNAEWVQTMAHLAGRIATIATREDRDLNWRTSYRVFIHGARTNGSIRLRSIIKSTRSYEGKVYCAKTQSGFFLVRYKGLIHVTGNTAKRFQPHNLPRGVKGFDMEQAWKDIHYGSLEHIRTFHGDPMTFLSNAIRGAVIAEDGKALYCADYSAVETCGLFWLADELAGMGTLIRGEDIYLELGSDIYNRKLTKADKDEREVGKRAVLGLGFGMGYIKFLVTCRGYGIDFSLSQVLDIISKDQLRELATEIWENDWPHCRSLGMTKADLPALALSKYIVQRYRAKYKHTVCALWSNAEKAAKAAIKNPTSVFTCGEKNIKLSYVYDGERFLKCLLPSGRPLYYPFPELVQDEKDRERIMFYAVDSKTHQWCPEYTYGGKLTENAVQATARDIMATNVVALDKTNKYELLMMVHDEVVAQAAGGNLAEFMAIISTVPTWAPGLPLKAEGWTGTRYKK